MKLRSKIIIIFILSLTLSVIVFMLGVWFLISHGWWSGLTQADIDSAAETAAGAVAKNGRDLDDLKQIFDSIKERYTGMELEYLSDSEGIVYSTSDTAPVKSTEELISTLSENGRYSRSQWVTAKTTKFREEPGYVIVIVPVQYYRAVSFYINGVSGYGIFGKMLILGFIIALSVSCGFAYVFTRKITRRYEALSDSIQSFDMGSLDVRIDDAGKDEIGRLAASFNNMARRLEEQINLEKSYEEERRKLVSNISHDLRTPLTSIIGYSESLENEIFESEEEEKRYLSIIRRKAEYMNTLLSELLEFSRLECSQTNPDLRKINIAELSREIIIEYLPLLEKEGIALSADIPETVGEIRADRDMLSRAIRNLLDNAIKYGASGKWLGYELSADHGSVYIKVKDNGQGIDSENQQNIFDRFYRGDKGRTQDGGMGLGLAIADEIVKLHDGLLSVESEKGHGATFIITLHKA